MVETVGSSQPREPILSVRDLSKRYGHVQALQDVNLDIYEGEVVGLVGDNGAGKSTLVNIMSGALRASSGEMRLYGKPTRLLSPIQARSLGIETVYQDLALAPDLTVWANFFVGREVIKPGIVGRLGWLDRRAMIAAAEAEVQRTRIRIGSVRTRVGSLSGGQRQAIAVARAVSWGSRLILMDEPTAALGVEQQQRVGEMITGIASRGIAVLLISHNLPQIRELCDRAVVLFQGRTVAELDPKKSNVEDFMRWITGAGLEDEG